MSNYRSSRDVTAAFERVALCGLCAAGMSTVELAAMGVWHGAAPDMTEMSGPYVEDSFDLLERLSLYNIVSAARQRELLALVQAHRQSQWLGGSPAFEKAFNQYLPHLQPLQNRHYVPGPSLRA